MGKIYETVEDFFYKEWIQNIPQELEYTGLGVEKEREGSERLDVDDYREFTERRTFDEYTFNVPEEDAEIIIEEYLKKPFKEITIDDLKAIDLKNLELWMLDFYYDDAIEEVEALDPDDDDSDDWEEVDPMDGYDDYCYERDRDEALERGE